MTSFPDAIDEFRTFTNLPGMVYDAAKTDVMYADDLNKIANTMINIETALGVDFLNIWPIGSVYYNADDNRNPHDIMGFGTWVVHAEGRSIFGKSSSGTFSTLGATGGAETVTLAITQIPGHTHDLAPSTSDGNVVHGGAGGSSANITQGGGQWRYTNHPSSGSSGGGGSHNNLAPYIVDCSWRRTA